MARHANRLLDTVRPQRKYPPMAPAARKSLSELYREANHGLDALIDRDDRDDLVAVVGLRQDTSLHLRPPPSVCTFG